MKFKAINIFNLCLTIVIVLLTTGSCNNDKSVSSENMEGMDMSEHDMEGMNKTATVSSGILDSLKIGSLVLPTNYLVISSQKAVKPIQNMGMNRIKGQGYVSVDERRNNKVAARFSGRIEKLCAKYNFEYVKKGEKIMEIYSPELNTYQEELLFLLKGNSDSSLVKKAEQKLQLLGVSQAQINDIKKTGKTLLTMMIYSPQEGYVFFKSPMNGSMKITKDNENSNKMGMGLSGNISNNPVSGNDQIREGNYVNKGDVLFWLNDLDEVWAMFAIDNSHEQELKLGAKVSLISELYKSDTVQASINFIEPVYQQNQKFIMSRIYLKNTNKKYKINSLVEGTISAPETSSIMVPYSSVLFLGKRKIVWILKERTANNSKIYEARDVEIGSTDNGMIEIKKGLNINEKIALDAGYLLDRESLIKPQ